MKTLHYNYVDQSGRVYCYKHNTLAVFDTAHILNKCAKCNYKYDIMLGGGGVICEFDDGCNEQSIIFEDAGDYEHHSAMVQARMGLKTEEEVLDSLKSYNDYSKKEEIDEDLPPEPEPEEEAK
jgi:hypothetical protein